MAEINKTTDIYESFQKLREYYEGDSDDLKRIDEDEKTFRNALEIREFANNPATQKIINKARREVIDARMELATNQSLILPENKQKADQLWFTIAARMWVIRQFTTDVEAEIQNIESLTRSALSKL